jgi:steroid 5-alpha reductase family enzyme
VQIALIGLASVLGVMALVWLASVRLRDVSIVDVFWGLGFVLLAWEYWWLAGGALTPRSLLVPVLVTVWGCRLAGYIAWRSHGKGEDYRYAAMREARGSAFVWSSLFVVFWLQAALLWVVAMPLLQVQTTLEPEQLGVFDVLGLTLFLVGLFFESVGDFQMARFKAEAANRGLVMDRGLWRYTRHPNYFGDAMVWWGLGCLALATPGSAWVLIGTALMTVLLMRVSGVSLLERGLHESKPGYGEYVRRTSPFFPRPPRASRDAAGKEKGATP